MADQRHPPFTDLCCYSSSDAKVCTINFIQAPVCGKTEIGVCVCAKIRVRPVRGVDTVQYCFVYVSCTYGNGIEPTGDTACNGLIKINFIVDTPRLIDGRLVKRRGNEIPSGVTARWI